MKHLDEQLKDYYHRVQLTPQQVESILAQTQTQPKPHQRFRHALAMAASIVLVIGLGLWLTLGPSGNTTDRIVAEIARNHLDQGALIVESGQYPVVQAALGKLSYSIQPKRDELFQAFALVGGKYCSIQGRQAAQLKLRQDMSGIMHTLYVWQHPRHAERLQPGVYETHGIQVELWTHQERLFGLARNL